MREFPYCRTPASFINYAGRLFAMTWKAKRPRELARRRTAREQLSSLGLRSRTGSPRVCRQVDATCVQLCFRTSYRVSTSKGRRWRELAITRDGGMDGEFHGVPGSSFEDRDRPDCRSAEVRAGYVRPRSIPRLGTTARRAYSAENRIAADTVYRVPVTRKCKESRDTLSVER